MGGTSRRNVLGAIARRQERSQLPEATMTETNHNANKLCQAPARAQQQQGPPCLTSRHRHTLSGARRRAYGDGETTAGLQQAGPSINDHHLQSAGTRKEARTRSATLTKKSDGNLFRLTNSYRNGHIDLRSFVNAPATRGRSHKNIHPPLWAARPTTTYRARGTKARRPT